MDAVANLREQPEIRKLFETLEENGLAKEQQEVESLVNYLENMESQFGKVLGELKEVRGQLTQIQDKGIRATAARVVGNVESKVQEIGGQIDLVKQNLIHSAKNAVELFKEKGVDALRKSVSMMKIPNVLSRLKEKLHSGMENVNKNAEKIGIIASELHQAKEHTKNAHRILFGRRVKEPTERNTDQGILTRIQKVLLSCGKIFSGMEKAAENAINRTEQFIEGVEKKPSVKAELKRMKREKSAEPAMQLPEQEKSR